MVVGLQIVKPCENLENFTTPHNPSKQNERQYYDRVRNLPAVLKLLTYSGHGCLATVPDGVVGQHMMSSHVPGQWSSPD